MQCGSSHDDGTDGIHLHIEAGVGLGRVEPGGDNDAGQRGQNTHQHKDRDPVASNGHTAALERLRVAAQGGHIGAPAHVVKERDEQDNDQKSHGDARLHTKEIAAAKGAETLGQFGDGNTLGGNEGEAPVQKGGGQGNDKGVDAGKVDEQAIDSPHDSAQSQGEGDGESNRQSALQCHSSADGAEREDGSHREVNGAGGDDAHHPAGQEQPVGVGL